MSFTYWLDHTLSGCQRPSARLTAGSQVNLFSAAVLQLPLIPGTPVRIHFSCPAQLHRKSPVLTICHCTLPWVQHHRRPAAVQVVYPDDLSFPGCHKSLFRLMITFTGDHQVMRFPATNTCFCCIAALSELERRCVISSRFGLHISNALAVKDRRSVMAYPCRISDYQRQQG